MRNILLSVNGVGVIIKKNFWKPSRSTSWTVNSWELTLTSLNFCEFKKNSEISRWIHDIFDSVHEFKFVWVWLSLIRYLFSEFTMNLLFSAILLSYLLFFCDFTISQLSFSWIHYESTIVLTISLWIHNFFCDFAMISFLAIISYLFSWCYQVSYCLFCD